MTDAAQKLLERISSWPDDDIRMLEEAARDIEAMQMRVYRPTDEELHALDEAERSGIASEEEVEAAFRTFRQ
jgi:hypothetical protein